MFGQTKDTPLRVDFFIVLLVLVSVPFVFRSAGQALGDRDNDVRQWLPAGSEQTARYDWFLKHFSSEEFALISWTDASINDQRINQLAVALRKDSEASNASRLGASPGRNEKTKATSKAARYNSTSRDRRLFNQIVTGPELLQVLQDDPLNLSLKMAKRRIQGSLLGADGQTTGLLAFVSEAGRADRHHVVNVIRERAAQLGIASANLRLGGPTIDSVALDQESERSRYLLASISLLLGSIAAWRCLRHPVLVVVVLLTSVFCGAATLAWVSVFGDRLNLVMVTMPTLVYVLTISGAIHVTHYFCAAADKVGLQHAMMSTIKTAWLPCVLTAATTAVGLGSLTVSHVNPVRLFGFYSALGVLTGLPIVLLFVPAVLTLVMSMSWLGRHEEFVPKLELAVASNRPSKQRLPIWADYATSFVVRRHASLSIAGVALILFSLGGLTRLETSVKLTNFFDSESRVIADYRWLEENLAPLVPIELVLRIPQDENGIEPTRMVDKLALVGNVQRAIANMPEVDGTVSAATFAPPVPRGSGLRPSARRTVIDKELNRNRESLVAAGYFQAEGDSELWRVSARVAALNDIDYGQFIDQIESVVDPVLVNYNENTRGNPVEETYTGIVPLVYKAQRVLLEDLISSFLLAFGIIAVVMLLMLRGFAAGLVSMIPNVFPAAVVFGSLGWLGIVCDIGSVITASVALGIAVDDTIHFLSWFRRGLASGLSRHAAIRESYGRCGKAMLDTTMICGLGMLGFAFSEFAPTSRFATLMAVLLCTALVGDLLLLPAILAGPLGKYFEQKPIEHQANRRSAIKPRRKPWSTSSQPVIVSA